MDRRQLRICAGIPVRVYRQRKIFTDRHICRAAGTISLDQPCGKDHGLGGAGGRSDRIGAATNEEG